MFDSDYEKHVPPHVRAAMERLPNPQQVWDIFRDDETVAEMERLSAQKRPAVGAASAKLLPIGGWVRGNDARKTFGKITRCIMELRGYAVGSKGVKTPRDPLFTRGTRYRLRALANPDLQAATLTVRDIDAETLVRLRRRAASHNRSIEAEVWTILIEALAGEKSAGGPNLAEAIHRRFAALGGIDDLPRHPPVPTEPPPEFDP